MKMKTNKLRDWRIHGSLAQSALMASVLPRGAVSYVSGEPGDARDAIVASLATAVASDVTICGLSDERASLAGFFHLPAQRAEGVAIVTAGDAERVSRSIAATALARGIQRPLNIGVLGVKGATATQLTGIHARLAELADHFEEGVGLVVLDICSIHQREILQFAQHGRAVLVVGNEAPASASGAILELASDRLTVSHAGCQSALKFDPVSASNIDPFVARVVTEGGRSPTGVTTHAAA
jgi:hypothetical protein